MKGSTLVSDKRNIYLDLLKTVAILMMLLGHCIQFGNGSDYDSFSNPLFRYIYSFHMPLFSIMGGYLAYYSIRKRSIKEFVFRQIKSMLVPILAWEALVSVVLAGLNFLKARSFTGAIKVFVIEYLDIFNRFWFLWGMLLASIIAAVIYYKCKNSVLCHFIVVFMSMFLPIENLGLWLFLYPFYIIGLYTHITLSSMTDRSHKNVTAITVISIVLHIVLFVFWDDNSSYIYGGHLFILRDEFILNNIFANIYRIIIGIVGSISTAGIVYFIYKTVQRSHQNSLVKFSEKLITFTGECTIFIYVFSTYFLNEFLRMMTGWGYSIVRNIVCTVVIYVICLLAALAIRQVKLARELLLGGR